MPNFAYVCCSASNLLKHSSFKKQKPLGRHMLILPPAVRRCSKQGRPGMHHSTSSRAPVATGAPRALSQGGDPPRAAPAPPCMPTAAWRAAAETTSTSPPGTSPATSPGTSLASSLTRLRLGLSLWMMISPPSASPQPWT